MVYSLCKNEYRHHDIVDEYRLQQSYTNEEDSYSSLEFEVAHDHQVLDRQLKKALAGLTDERRAAYTLHYEEELPVQEIAQILYRLGGTVKSRSYYILEVLQCSLSGCNPRKQINMRSDDLEGLEESQEMQRLIHAAKKQYGQGRSAYLLVTYAAFVRNLRGGQKDGEMKAKQRPPERGASEVKGEKRSGISPWWLMAMCLLGGIIGHGISTTSGRQEADLERLAVADTVIVIHERVDTIYREVGVPSQPLVVSRSTVKSKSTGFTKERVKQSRKTVQKAEPAFISIGFL